MQITPNGTKSFQLRAWSKKHGKPAIKTIGTYPKLSIAEARSQALKLLNQLNDGVDVIEEAKAFREEAIFEEAFNAWLEVAKHHKRTWKNDITTYKNYIEKPFGQKRLSWFTKEKIESWHASLTKCPRQRGKAPISQATANRAFALLSTVFNSNQVKLAFNPCHGVKKFKEIPRDRFLSPDELRRFFEALNDPATPNDLRDYVLLSLFTGARRANVLGMRWNDIDFNQQTWRIPPSESKNGEPMLIPLTVQAVEILQRRKAGASSIFVLPGDGASGHYVEPKTGWDSLKKRVGLTDLRLHDLRRTMGSFQAISGSSLAIIGKSLGHKTSQATQVYARLDLDPVRASMERATALMLAARELSPKVVALHNE